jgi:putative transposase
MPRIARGLADGYIYHVLNRGNGKQEVFHKPADYQAFINLMHEAKELYPLGVFGYCLMPNHFHIVVCPKKTDHLSGWMHWLMTSHVRRYHAHYRSCGHVWQGRYKSFIIQKDNHLLTVLRYVESNPVKANLVKAALDWQWSSHRETVGAVQRNITDDLPIDCIQNWASYIDKPQNDRDIEMLKRSVERQTPFGDDKWQRTISKIFGLESTLRPRGRPRRMIKK